MKKYLTSLTGKRYTVEEVLLWPQSRQRIHFDKEFRQLAVERTKKQMTPEVRERLRQKALKQTHSSEYIATLKARWADPDYKAKVTAKIRATRAKQMADPEFRKQRNEKRKATIAAKIKANPNWMAEKLAKEKATKAKSGKWQEWLAKVKINDTRRKGKKPKSYKKGTKAD